MYMQEGVDGYCLMDTITFAILSRLANSVFHTIRCSILPVQECPIRFILQLATTRELNEIKGEVRSVLGTIKPMNDYHAFINQTWGNLTHNFGVSIITKGESAVKTSMTNLWFQFFTEIRTVLVPASISTN
jgi:hypothetical protein